MEQVVVLFSGGADSTLLLEMAKSIGRKPLAILIDYGQLHKEELEYAEKYCKEQNIEYRKVVITGYSVDSGLTGSGEKSLYENVHSHNVPCRNSIFLSIACGFAESLKIKEVWYGANFDDYENRFPDCYQEYIAKFNEVMRVSASRPVKVVAPLLGMNKKMIKELMKLYNISEEKVFSGYGIYS